MECLEDSVVISEVSLGTADISHMGQLEKQAEVRRTEVQAMENTGDVSVNGINDETRTSSRKVAKERAEAMINYRWTVLASHKIESSANADKIIIPKCVMDAEVGSTFRGIPYCWGGYNGLNDVGKNSSFANVVGEPNRTAGNIQSEYNGELQGHISDTIGIDCSGFVISAYNMSGTKYGTGHLLQLGNSVAVTEIKPMDFIVKNGHTMLFLYRAGNNFITYEAFSDEDNNGNEIGGKTMRWQRSLVDLSTEGYTFRNPFHTGACNQNGEWAEVGDGVHHAPTCTLCDYVVIAQKGYHDLNGGVTGYEEFHIYICSVCGAEADSEEHIFSKGCCVICSYTE